MVPTYDMYSPTARHQSSTYALAQNYGHQTYSQYTDNINFNPCGVMDNGMNNNYQQNLPSSWPIYTMSPSNNPSRQHVLLEDWMPLTTSPNNYQTQNVMHFSTDNTQTFHLQRNIGDVGPADYSLNSSEHMRIQEKLEPSSETHEHPSSDSVVAVSSDGMSGTESPILPIHMNHSTGNVLCRPQPARSPYEWIKRTSYQSQPNPGRTRTKDKYRIVYTDHQRLELEKEFHYSRYITIRRKVELAASLNLSERQIKIWFQNRRAKERRQAKKREELLQKNKDAQVVYQHTSALNIANISIY